MAQSQEKSPSGDGRAFGGQNEWIMLFWTDEGRYEGETVWRGCDHFSRANCLETARNACRSHAGLSWRQAGRPQLWRTRLTLLLWPLYWNGRQQNRTRGFALAKT